MVAHHSQRAARYTARPAARKPFRRTAVIAAAAAVGAIAASAGAAPWASAASGVDLTSRELAVSKPAGPTVIYDSIHPSAIPAGKAIAAYSNGAYQASPAQVAGHGKVLWIDIKGSDTSADALDVEPGDATPADAAAWASAKLTKDPSSTVIIYTFKAAWGRVISDINALPAWMHSHVKYWIADPTGSPHLLPGAAATQWYWGAKYDISAAQPGFAS
jgi:hypothetical protein